MGYEDLVNTLKAIAITAPAARAFELTVEFALGPGKDTATVGRLEDFRDRPAMHACIERMRAGEVSARLAGLHLREGDEAPGLRAALRR